MRGLHSIFICLLIFTAVAFAAAADANEKTAQEVTRREALYKEFKETLSGVKMVGKFTVIGKEDGPLKEDQYTIENVEKLPDGDFWLFIATIKYADKDVKLPLRLEVKWADTTPIITLTNLSIPGLGTFSCRVVIYDKKYAGTWSHGDVSGHLFGVIKKLTPADAKTP